MDVYNKMSKHLDAKLVDQMKVMFYSKLGSVKYCCARFNSNDPKYLEFRADGSYKCQGMVGDKLTSQTWTLGGYTTSYVCEGGGAVPGLKNLRKQSQMLYTTFATLASVAFAASF